MRGSPIFRTCVVLALLLLAALPLRHLTRARSSDTPAVASAAVESPTSKTVLVHLKFAHAPRSVQLLHLGKPVWNSPANGGVLFNTELAIPFPREGVDLELVVQWPEGTPETAVQFNLETPDGSSMGKTIWGRGRLDEVITFP